MKLLTDKTPHRIVADEGKHIRGIDDVYQEPYIDDDGNVIDAHFPFYSTTIYVPDDFTEEDMFNLYIEESEE